MISHPAVLEAAVIGRADRDGLVKPKAFVILRDVLGDRIGCADHGVAGTREGADRGVEVSEVDRVYVDTLPKTATGKIQRFRLREL